MQGHYHSNKKNGDGIYHFLNQDVFEGEFTADRMDGYGVYTFSNEGRSVLLGRVGGLGIQVVM